MFAQIGNIEFNNLTSFIDFTSTAPSTTPQHNTISGKPTLQPSNHDLKEFRISIRLHAGYCNPTNELKKISELYEKSEPVPFILGDGTILGKFAITSMEVVFESSLPDGTGISILVALSLLEYVTNTITQSVAIPPSRSAPSVGNKVVVSSSSKNIPSCSQEVAGHISTLDNNRKALLAAISEKGGIIYPDNKSKAMNCLTTILPILQKLENGNGLPCVLSNPEIKSISSSTIPISASCKNYVLSGNVVLATIDANNISRNIDLLKSAATPIIKSSITRR